MHKTPTLAEVLFISNMVFRYELARREDNYPEMLRSLPGMTQRQWAAFQRKMLPALLEAEQKVLRHHEYIRK